MIDSTLPLHTHRYTQVYFYKDTWRLKNIMSTLQWVTMEGKGNGT